MTGLFQGLTEFADRLDFYTLILTIVCGIITLGTLFSMLYFSWKYHHTKKSDGQSIQSYKLEIAFTLFTFIGFMVFFAWATVLYKDEVEPKEPDYEIFVYGKRWMWKYYHPNGFASVNTLHLPQGKNVRLTMISKDVIHSFFVPGFRTKQDVLPGRYTFLNFNVKKTGTFPLYCAEYCGSYHSRMTGEVKVLPEAQYQKLIQDPKIVKPSQGRDLFTKHGCITCHRSGSQIAPPVELLGKGHDDNELRRSIYYPKEKIAEGYEGVMPSYLNVVSEEETRFLIQYIRDMEAK